MKAKSSTHAAVHIDGDAGDHVGILMSNCQEFVDLLIGAQMLGAWPVPINARYKAKELRYVIADADLNVLVTTDRIVEHVDFVALLNESFPSLGDQVDAHSLSLPEASALKSIVLIGDRVPTGMIG